MRQKTVLAALVALALLAVAPAQVPKGGAGAYDALKREAEREFAEKSFSRAREIYEQAAKLELTPEERRWVEFRIADTTWRSTGDATIRQKAKEALEDILRRSRENHDRVWAEVNESLGDLESVNQPHWRSPQGQSYYLAALDWWAGSDDLPLARRRYLAIAWRMAGERNAHAIPRDVLVNILGIAESPKDRARARYLLALQLLGESRPESVERAFEHLEAIIAMGKTTEWYDDALFLLAQNLAAGRNVIVENGEVERHPDYQRALELYRRLVAEFARGESPLRDNAVRLIDEIVMPSVGVSVAGTFLPDSEQEVVLTWRNVKRIELTLTKVDLTTDIQRRRNEHWANSIQTEGRPVVRRWTFETNDKGDHAPGIERLRLTPRLERGAYILSARAENESARQLLLVTDLHILLQQSMSRLQVFVSDVLTGEPVAGARVAIFEHDGNRQTAQTNASGIAVIKLVREGHGDSVITASSGARQAWHSTYTYRTDPRRETFWRIYAFTDRPAYRPEETVQWKIIARAKTDAVWTTPSGETLIWEITNPRGEKVSGGDAKLSAFGSFFAELPLNSSMPLGLYHINFRTKDTNQIGGAQLFRLEEYKLPEFLVSVKTPEENGRRKLYRLGETIEATIEASYYFGGPVANATVEAVVHQQPYVRYWYPWREYEWYYMPPPSYHGQSILKRETLKTDATGRAILRIETPRDGNETLYRIEARVVDASRREVRGEGTVRAGKQRYSVIAHPEHFLHRPSEQVEVAFKAVDANDQPVQTTGTVKVVKREWRTGNRACPDRQDCLSPTGYRDEEVMTTKVTTNASGEGTFTFTPKSTGYYSIHWTSEDRDPGKPLRARDLVTAQTAVFVADRATRDVGYHSGGLEIILDKETYRQGQTAAVMLASPMSGRWVVLTTTAEDFLDTQVVRMDGTVKLVEIPIDERHVPNFFVNAASVFARELAMDSERVVVPPVEQFVNVEVKADREEYEPRQEGTVTITTRDVDGKPVSAEVAVAVSDEAVTAIQQDLAGDPRVFFYGDTRHQAVQTTAGLHSQQYVRLVEGEEKQLYDDRYAERDEMRRRVGAMKSSRDFAMHQEGAALGDAANLAAPPPSPVAPPPPPEAAMAKEGAAAGATPIDVQVRTDFRSTAFWKPDIVTDASGTATVKLNYPQALTTWRAVARAATAGSQFGIGSTTARTSMPLIVRLQAPRFFVAGDRVVVSAVINNNTDEPMSVEPHLDAEGVSISGGQALLPVQVPPHGEARADWTVLADKAGMAKLRVTGRGAKHGDAMEKSFVVYEHGIDKLIARSGKLRGSEALVRLDLPRERRATDLVVQVAPSLAVTMLDALPYLIEYPYGCTEQTMSRFLPAAIVAQTLREMGLPARDEKKLADVTKKSMARLYDFQHADGGWGWWKEGSSDVFMTAYVVWGFAIARDAGLPVDEARVQRAWQWLDENLSEGKGDWNTDAWMLHAMSAWTAKPSANGRKAFDDVWENRERLTSYSRALLALTAHRFGDAQRAAVLVRNLENGAKIDRTPDQSVLIRGGSSTAETMATVHWGSDRFWWHWWDGPVETTAFVLQALVTIDPKHKYVEPAMNWLVKNRRGAQWSNTRDTAIAVLALNDYLRASGETLGDVSYEVSVNGRVIATKTLTAKDAIAAPSRFSVDPLILADTQQEIRIRRTGGRADAPLYFSAEARFVSLEDPVKAAGNELFVRREYFRLAPKPTLLKGVVYDRVPLGDRDSIKSGERVEVVVTIETKNDYEYLMFEDLKPAGFEAVELQSGHTLYATDKERRSAWVYQELRDRKVAMFIDRLQQGIWEIRYTLRAEVPGTFHALPLLGQAMYVPDIRANGDEVRVEVRE